MTAGCEDKIEGGVAAGEPKALGGVLSDANPLSGLPDSAVDNYIHHTTYILHIYRCIETSVDRDWILRWRSRVPACTEG